MQLTIFCSLAGGGLIYGCFQIYPENAETILYVAIVNIKVIIFVSQSNQQKFRYLNTWSKILVGVYFRGIKFLRIDGKFCKIC